MVRVRVGIGLVVVAVAAMGWAADWPQWRGPAREAVCTETGLLKQWPQGGPPLLWDITGCGRGFSSVSIVGNRLFTMGDLVEGGERKQYVIAFDLATRRRVWIAKVGEPHNDGPRCTPTVDDGLIYAIGTEGDLVCVRADSGQEVWRKSFPNDFGGRMMSVWKYSESPLVDGEKLICTPGGDEAAVVALNKKTGEVIWKCAPPRQHRMGGAGYASCVVSEGAGVRQYVTVMGRGAIGVRADDGQFLWAYHRIANGTANIPTPVTVDDYVFVSTAYGTGAALLKLTKADDGVKAEQVYWLGANTFQCHHGGFVRIGDYLYGAHGHNAGNPLCIELKTGKVLWRERQVGEGSGCVLYADGHLIYRYENKVVALIEANPQAYKLKGQFRAPDRPRMGGPAWPHPVVCDGKLYLRHHDVLFCYDVKAK